MVYAEKTKLQTDLLSRQDTNDVYKPYHTIVYIVSMHLYVWKCPKRVWHPQTA